MWLVSREVVEDKATGVRYRYSENCSTDPGKFDRIATEVRLTITGMSMDVDAIEQARARTEATNQWNARACGELDGDQNTSEYFRNVESDRYAQQPWQHSYFRFDAYRDKDVLEIGIGQGSDLLQFGRAGARCHGVDITDNHISLTKRNFQLNGISVDILKADAASIPFADSTFDCVYSFGVVHHIPDASHVIAEAHRVLKPGGQLMIALYYKWSAFHLFTKILSDGMIKGWFFTKGYAGTLSTIETGADGIRSKPYVRLYSKKEMAELVSAFQISDISVHQLAADHFSPLLAWLMPQKAVQLLENRLGWYVTCKATKG